MCAYILSFDFEDIHIAWLKWGVGDMSNVHASQQPDDAASQQDTQVTSHTRDVMSQLHVLTQTERKDQNFFDDAKRLERNYQREIRRLRRQMLLLKRRCATDCACTTCPSIYRCPKLNYYTS